MENLAASENNLGEAGLRPAALIPDTPRKCPVCDQPYLVYVTRKPTVRTRVSLPVYACLNCLSFSNPSSYRESPEQLLNDLQWHKGVAERNTAASRVLLPEIESAGVDISRIVEIGAGIGTLLKCAREFGATGIGYEVNPLTQPYAQEVNGVDVRAEHWTPDTDCGIYSLMVCIMVLEHIAEPRDLIHNMVTSCIKNRAALFISVPFLDRERWHFLHCDDPREPGNVFFDNDVHVTHFSSAALESVLREFGMTSVTWIRKGLWHGPLARA